MLNKLSCTIFFRKAFLVDDVGRFPVFDFIICMMYPTPKSLIPGEVSSRTRSLVRTEEEILADLQDFTCLTKASVLNVLSLEFPVDNWTTGILLQITAVKFVGPVYQARHLIPTFKLGSLGVP
ncbi:hypothetical protein VNO77_34213 [Canavalia gladiata]|uniref:Uncharacterized protein n=1 Tax=Canavalia gladiata TaxID=3824 RepID=A0AAN9PZ23_CANGL